MIETITFKNGSFKIIYVEEGSDYTVTTYYNKNKEIDRQNGPAVISVFENGYTEEQWIRKNKLDKKQGPAKILYDEKNKVIAEWYYVNDKLHRENGPAFIGYNLSEYYLDGKKLTRKEWHNKVNNKKINQLDYKELEDKELLENGNYKITKYLNKDKTKIIGEYYFNNNNMFNRKNKPAVIKYYKNCETVKKLEFYKNGKRHRINGPATIWYTKSGEIIGEHYWINNKTYLKQEFDTRQEVVALNKRNNIIILDDYITKELLDNGNYKIYNYFDNKRTKINYECYYNSKDEVHRLDGPASIWYYKDGEIISELYYINSKEYTKEEFNKKINKNKEEHMQTINIKGVKHYLVEVKQSDQLDTNMNMTIDGKTYNCVSELVHNTYDFLNSIGITANVNQCKLINEHFGYEPCSVKQAKSEIPVINIDKQNNKVAKEYISIDDLISNMFGPDSLEKKMYNNQKR